MPVGHVAENISIAQQYFVLLGGMNWLRWPESVPVYVLAVSANRACAGKYPFQQNMQPDLMKNQYSKLTGRFQVLTTSILPKYSTSRAGSEGCTSRVSYGTVQVQYQYLYRKRIRTVLDSTYCTVPYSYECVPGMLGTVHTLLYRSRA